MAGIETESAVREATGPRPAAPDRARRRSRRNLLAPAASVAILLVTAMVDAVTAPSAAAVPCPAGSQVAVVAHADDDLLFMNPDVPRRVVEDGWCTTTIVVTSGDAGLGVDYTEAREAGLRAAYAEMAGADDRWVTSTATVQGHRVARSVLVADPGVRLEFLRLPDGNIDGSGFPSERFESIERLRLGRIASVRTIEPSPQMYTEESLRATLRALVAAARPSVVRTLDHLHDARTDGDHSDHHEVALLAVDARDVIAPSVRLVPYLGYPSSRLAPNLTSAQVQAKERAFMAYTPYDWRECWTLEACAARPEGAWLQRMHQADGRTDGATAGERRQD